MHWNWDGGTQRQADLCEFRDSLICSVSSGEPGLSTRETLSQTKAEHFPPQKKIHTLGKIDSLTTNGVGEMEYLHVEK